MVRPGMKIKFFFLNFFNKSLSKILGGGLAQWYYATSITTASKLQILLVA